MPHLCEYSIALTPKKIIAQESVAAIMPVSFLCSLVWAQRTAQAIVNELKSRTPVLIAPSLVFKNWLQPSNTSGRSMRKIA